MNDFSANEFEKRALLGFAPVYSDGSFRIKVPADTPISFATLDEHGRGFVVKRTWLYVRPGEEFDQVRRLPRGPRVRRTGADEPESDRGDAARDRPQRRPSEYTIINYENDIGPIVHAKCACCHSRRSPRKRHDPGAGEPRPDRGAGHRGHGSGLPARLRQPVGRDDG